MRKWHFMFWRFSCSDAALLGFVCGLSNLIISHIGFESTTCCAEFWVLQSWGRMIHSHLRPPEENYFHTLIVVHSTVPAESFPLWTLPEMHKALSERHMIYPTHIKTQTNINILTLFMWQLCEDCERQQGGFAWDDTTSVVHYIILYKLYRTHHKHNPALSVSQI